VAAAIIVNRFFPQPLRLLDKSWSGLFWSIGKRVSKSW